MNSKPKGRSGPTAQRWARHRLGARRSRGYPRPRDRDAPDHPQHARTGPRPQPPQRSRGARCRRLRPRAALVRPARREVHRRDDVPRERPPQPPTARMADRGPAEAREALVPDRRHRTARSVRPPSSGYSRPQTIASVLPNIYDADQLAEFVDAPETPPLTSRRTRANRRPLRTQLRSRCDHGARIERPRATRRAHSNERITPPRRAKAAARSSSSRSTASTRRGAACRTRTANAASASWVPRSKAFSDRLQTRAYSVVGMRGDADFLLWQIGESLDDIQQLASAINGTPHGRRTSRCRIRFSR